MLRERKIPVQDQEGRAELETVLSSRLFRRAPSLAKLLSYLCDKYFNGQVDQIKEYTIAVEFYQRSADFHSKEDPIVRVDANRLRARLKEYYLTEGKENSVRILIPSGQYAPVFEYRQAGGSAGSAGAAVESPEEHPEPPDVSPDQNASSIIPEYGASAAQGQQPPEEAVGFPPPQKPHRMRRGLYYGTVIALPLAIIVTIVILLSRVHRGNVSDPPTEPIPAAAGSPSAVVPEGPELRIMAGSTLARYVDRYDEVWMGDRFFRGGEVVEASPTSLLRAEDSPLCRLSRQGDFDYDIPLRPGIYELHLYFVEMLFGFEPEEGGETSRLFDVFANGRPLLKMFDVYSDAGGGGRLDERVFTDISPSSDGKLHLSFRSFKSKALINGMEILPGTAGRMRPVRITTRPSNFLSSDQRLWESDRYFSGGRSVVRLRSVEAEKDAELYQSERYGNFTYTIPLAQGRYTVTLKFAETYFGLGPTNPSGSGPGMRVFDVYCNGEALLKDFDIIREAGGVNRPLDKVFHGLQPNTQGKLILVFSPVVNYACVNAIEVIPE